MNSELKSGHSAEQDHSEETIYYQVQINQNNLK